MFIFIKACVINDRLMFKTVPFSKSILGLTIAFALSKDFGAAVTVTAANLSLRYLINICQTSLRELSPKLTRV